MNLNKKHGERGEAIAADFLTGKGYSVIKRNYRYKRAEIDLIAQKNDILIFVEVKARSSQNFGFPEEAVNEKKADMVIMAANQFIMETEWDKEIRFDIIAITFLDVVEIVHLEDAFY